MKTLSADEYKKKYGEVSYDSFKPAQKQEESGFSKRLKDAAGAGISKVKEGFNQIGQPGLKNKVYGSLKAGEGAVQTAFSPVATALEPVVKPTIGKATTYVADKISDSKAVQRFASSPKGEAVSEDLGALADLGGIAGAFTGMKFGSKAAGAGVRAAENTVSNVARGVENTVGKTAQNIQKGTRSLGGFSRDVLPTQEKFINSEIAKAFDLTPGDLKNIYSSTGNDVGSFVVKNNLISHSIEDTAKLIDDFSTKNYKTVRDQIGQVKSKYTVEDVPRYNEALTEIKKQIGEVPGLQKANGEVDKLLAKADIELADVQRVKELMDDHFNLYKITGDVKEGISKQGLTNIRRDLKSFIENEVKKNTGQDIKPFNNNVQTAQSILKAIEDRSGRGLTRANIGLNDLFTLGGGSVFGGPIGGVAALFLKKVRESPSVRLRIVKYLKELDEAKQMKIKSDLMSGQIPPELNQFVKRSSKPESKGIIATLKDKYESSGMSDEGGFLRIRPEKKATPARFEYRGREKIKPQKTIRVNKYNNPYPKIIKSP